MSALRLGERSRVTAQVLEARAQVEVQGGLVLGMERELKLGFTDSDEILHDDADHRLLQARQPGRHAGGYGVFLAGYSYVVERESALVSASLVTRRDGRPLLAFAMTAPHCKRKGLAKATIGNVMQDLFEAGEAQLQLVVNAKNQPALDLYLSRGFKELRRDA